MKDYVFNDVIRSDMSNTEKNDKRSHALNCQANYYPQNSAKNLRHVTESGNTWNTYSAHIFVRSGAVLPMVDMISRSPNSLNVVPSEVCWISMDKPHWFDIPTF